MKCNKCQHVMGLPESITSAGPMCAKCYIFFNQANPQPAKKPMMTKPLMTQFGTERFPSPAEGDDSALIVEYEITEGEPRTWEYPGSEPDCKIKDVYIRSKMKTEDLLTAIDLLEAVTGLPIYERLQERILEENA